MPSGPISANVGDPVHINVTATDPDTLGCTDPENKDILTLTQTTGPGTFVDNGNGDGDYDWPTDAKRHTIVTFNVDDGKGGSENVSVDVTVTDPNVPTVSEWGMTGMCLLLLAAGTIVIRQRKSTTTGTTWA